MLTWLFVIQAAAGAVLCALLARRKGRDVSGWFLVGIVFGLLAVILIALLPRLKTVVHPRLQKILNGETEPVNDPTRCSCCGRQLTLILTTRYGWSWRGDLLLCGNCLGGYDTLVRS